MSDKKDYLKDAKNSSLELSITYSLIAIAERLDKQNELLERIAVAMENQDIPCDADNIPSVTGHWMNTPGRKDAQDA